MVGAWNARVSLLSAAVIEAGRTYHIVALLASDGALRLYVDGVLDAEADGLRELPGGFSQADVGTCRAQNYCGRWMRPGSLCATSGPVLAAPHRSAKRPRLQQRLWWAAFHAPVGEPHASPKPVAARGATAGQRSAAHNVIMLRLATHAGLTSRHHCARACCRLKSTTASCAAPMPRASASMGWRRRRRRRWRCRRPSRSRRPSQRRGTRGVARWTECRSWLACPSSVRIQRNVFYENPYYNNAGAG